MTAVNINDVLGNIRGLVTLRVVPLHNVCPLLIRDAQKLLAICNHTKRKTEATSEANETSFELLTFPSVRLSDGTVSKYSSPYDVAQTVYKEYTRGQFFFPDQLVGAQRKPAQRDYVSEGIIPLDDVREIVETLLAVSSQARQLSYFILASKLQERREFKWIKNGLDLNLDHLIDSTYIDISKEPSIFLRKCCLCSQPYVDSFHHIMNSVTYGYDPYCQMCVGFGGSEWANLDYKPADDTCTNDLEVLKEYANAIGTIPTKETMQTIIATPDTVKSIFDIWVRLPSYRYYAKKYGDFRIPLIKQGLLPDKVMTGKYGYFCVAKDGHQCRSLAELKIDNWLYDNGIEHEVEPLYPKHKVLNPKARKKADWKVGDIYIEYWGLTGNPTYERKMEVKIRLSKELGLVLIGLTIDDLVNLDESLGQLLGDTVVTVK